MADHYAEKRDFLRMDIECKMTYRSGSDSAEKEGIAKNLSAAGFLLDLSEAFPAEAELTVKLTPMNTLTPPMEAKVSVIRSIAIEGTNPQRYDVACTTLNVV